MPICFYPRQVSEDVMTKNLQHSTVTTEAALPPRLVESCHQCKRAVFSDARRLDWLLETLRNGGPRGLAAAISDRDEMERPILDRAAIDRAMTQPNRPDEAHGDK